MKPIIFNTEMVQAILRGDKTQTRRIVKPPKDWDGQDIFPNGNYGYKYTTKDDQATQLVFRGPMKYVPGDILYVRESFSAIDYGPGRVRYAFKADDSLIHDQFKWKPSIHMPKEAARIFLKVKSTRVERLRDISENDAIAEGVRVIPSSSIDATRYKHYLDNERDCFNARQSFMTLWSSIHGKESWFNDNPWVWVIEFEVLQDFVQWD